MSRTTKTPSPKGASLDLPGGWTRTLPTFQALQAQTLMVAHHVRPEWAAMLAALAFGGGAYHG